MVKLKKKIEARSIVGKQEKSLRTTIPREITNYIEIKAGDFINWTLKTNRKTKIYIEVLLQEDQENKKVPKKSKKKSNK